MFFAMFHYIVFLEGPVLVQKILVVRSNSGSPQSARSVGTLSHEEYCLEKNLGKIH